MKRRITEIYIEVEETVAIRLSEQKAHTIADIDCEATICPQCGQTITKNTEKNLERRESDDKL